MRSRPTRRPAPRTDRRVAGSTRHVLLSLEKTLRFRESLQRLVRRRRADLDPVCRILQQLCRLADQGLRLQTGIPELACDLLLLAERRQPVIGTRVPVAHLAEGVGERCEILLAALSVDEICSDRQRVLRVSGV